VGLKSERMTSKNEGSMCVRITDFFLCWEMVEYLHLIIWNTGYTINLRSELRRWFIEGTKKTGASSGETLGARPQGQSES
jgi:hypothetical protein